MDIAGLRNALAAALPTTGWTVYKSVVGAPELPALMVGLPDTITLGASMGLTQVDLPIHVLVSMADQEDAQLKLSQALTTGSGTSVAEALAAVPRGSYWRSLNVIDINKFTAVTLGNGTVALTADINLTLLVNS